MEEQISIQLLIEKMIGQDLEVTDKEAEDYFGQNQAFFPEETEFEAVKSEVKETLKQQKMGEKFQAWLEELKQKTKILYFLEL